MEKNNNNDFIFVIGCPRSGTTVLTTLLESYFSIAIPVETHFIPLFRKSLFLWGNLEKYENRRKLLKCIYAFLEIWTLFPAKGRDADKIRKFSLLSTKEEMESILKESRSYSEIVINMYMEYAKRFGKSRFGDKSAFFQHIPIEHLQESVGKNKVIHIIRDGRDVGLSWTKTWFGPPNLPSAAKLWKTHVLEKREWGARNADKYLEIKYEDLLNNFDDVLEQISSFLEFECLEGQSVPQAGELASILSAGGTHDLLISPVDKSNQNKWKISMSEKDRMLFEYIAGRTLVSYGYEIERFDLNLKQRSQIFIRIAYSYIINFFSVRQVKLRLKSALPLVLFISAAIRFPLKKFLN